MRSNVCKIEKGAKALDGILKECEKVASYNELPHKQALQLRLLCEELDAMLPNVIGEYDGKLWIEFEDGVCKVSASIEIAALTIEEKKELINIAGNKKNAAAVGLGGRIRSALEDFFLDGDPAAPLGVTTDFYPMATGYHDTVMDYSYVWSFEQYRKYYVEEKKEEWDALEKSVLAAVADDIIVGVKGSRADITIVKNFAKGEEK